MSKEELKKEAEEWVMENENGFLQENNYSPYSFSEQAYVAGAEPREKLIKELKKENAELENQIADIKANCDLAIEGRDVKIKELEAQIEKMKCCKNCLYNGECDLGGYEECKNFDKWEIKEDEQSKSNNGN